MGSISFELDKKRNLSAKGSIYATKKQVGEDNFAQQIRELYELYSHLKASYLKALKNDGKIIGTERSELINYADTFINDIVLMVKYLNGMKNFLIVSLDALYAGLHFTIAIQNDSWTGSGRLPESMLLPVESLAAFFTSELNPSIITLLETYKNAVADAYISEEENKDLIKESKELLACAIYLRFQIAYCLINK